MRLDSLAVEIRSGNISFEDAARQYSTADNARQGGVVTNSADGSGRFDENTVKEQYPTVGIPGLDVGEISNATAFRTSDNHDAYRIIRLNRKYPSHRANLNDDYDNIYNAALASAKQKFMRQWAQNQVRKTFVKLSPEYQDCTFKNLSF